MMSQMRTTTSRVAIVCFMLLCSIQGGEAMKRKRKGSWGVMRLFNSMMASRANRKARSKGAVQLPISDTAITPAEFAILRQDNPVPFGYQSRLIRKYHDKEDAGSTIKYQYQTACNKCGMQAPESRVENGPINPQTSIMCGVCGEVLGLSYVLISGGGGYPQRTKRFQMKVNDILQKENIRNASGRDKTALIRKEMSNLGKEFLEQTEYSREKDVNTDYKRKYDDSLKCLNLQENEWSI